MRSRKAARANDAADVASSGQGTATAHIQGSDAPRRLLIRAPSSETDSLAPITAEEERMLLRYYERKIMTFCNTLHFPTKVKASPKPDSHADGMASED